MPDADWWDILWPEPSRVLAELGLQCGMEAIDLCCGDGLFTVAMAKICRHVTGIDIEPEILAKANARMKLAGVANCDLILGNAYDIAVLVRTVLDFVLLANTLHGVPDQLRLGRAVASVLNPAGRFALVNRHRRPREETKVLGQPRGPATQMRLEPSDAAELLAPAGLGLVNLVELLLHHYGAIFQKESSHSRRKF